VIEFAVKSDKKSAKIYVKIERGAIAIDCLDFFDAILKNHSKKLSLLCNESFSYMSPKSKSLDKYLCATYSVWEKLSSEKRAFINENLDVFRKSARTFLEDVGVVCSQAARWDVASVIDTQFPDFERINECHRRLEEYRMNKKEPVGEFLQAYNALHKVHEIVIGTTEKAIRELKEAMK